MLATASWRVEPVVDAATPPPLPPDLIEWSAPPECPDDAELERRVADAVERSDGSSMATAVVQRVEDRYVVDLVTEIDGEAQHKHLEATDCDGLADAVAVVVALTLDPAPDAPAAEGGDAATQQSIDAAAVTPEPPAVVDASSRRTRGVATPPPTDAAPERIGDRFELGLRIMGGYGSGLAPRGGGVVSTALSIGRDVWSVELEGRLWTPRDIRSASGDFGATMLLGTVGVAGCLRPRTRVVEVPLCLGLEGGAARARGHDLLGAATVFYPWAAPLLRVGLRARIAAGVGFVAAVEAAVPIRRPVVAVGGSSPLWSTPAVSARVLVGLQFRTPGPQRGESR